MAWRVCPVDQCPALVEPPARTCVEHTYTTKQRGYGQPHVKLRAKWARKVAMGEVICWRCDQRISALEPWDLGHDDTDRTMYRGPEHRACNRATSGR
jgi:hypothetical protein